jgi:hypothetical protein
MTDTPTDEDSQVVPFATILRQINNGLVADELADQMQALVAAVVDHRRKGKLVLTIEVAPRKGMETALNVAASSTLTLPKPEPVEDVFFASSGGNLLRDDPRQLAIPGTVRQVPNPYENEKVRQV